MMLIGVLCSETVVYSDSLVRMAKKGNTQAQYDLAQCYYHARGVKQNFKTAVKWYTKAAKKKHPEASYSLGLSYFLGEGVKKDYKKSAKWMLSAAENRQRQAQNFMGWMYFNGDGVSQNYRQACFWWWVDHYAGNKEAYNDIRKLETELDKAEIEKCRLQAVKWLQKFDI